MEKETKLRKQMRAARTKGELIKLLQSMEIPKDYYHEHDQHARLLKDLKWDLATGGRETPMRIARERAIHIALFAGL